MFTTQNLIYSVRIGAACAAVILFIAATGISENFYILRFAAFGIFGALSILFLQLGNKRIALASALTAVLFNPFAYLSLPREIWVILDILAIGGVIYATYWATDSYKKGTRFEDYIVTLFPESDFTIQDRTRDTGKHIKRRVESDGHPDFVFRSIQSGKVFAIECKWRGRWAWQPNGGQGIWWNMGQQMRYEAYQKETGIPVYVAFGVGGSPEKPAEVYFLELDRLRYPFLYRSLIKSGKVAESLISELK
jgi:hypothetical protein